MQKSKKMDLQVGNKGKKRPFIVEKPHSRKQLLNVEMNKK